MRIRFLILSLLLILGIGFISYQVTHALLSDIAKSTNNTFTAAQISSSPTPTPTPTSTPTPTPDLSGIANHVVISEVQIDGGTESSNDNDFIELYNPTSSAVNLDGFRLIKRTGSASTDTNIFPFTISHTIPAHGFFLWGHKSGGAIPNNFADTISADVSSAGTLGANNSVALRQGDLNTGTIIDALSWNSGAFSLKEGTEFSPDPGVNQSMERKALSTSTAPSMAIGGADEFKGNGYDTDSNSTNFVLRSVSQPQNSSSGTEMP